MENNEYNLVKRLDHIAYMLNVHTAGKKYENFIVNAIYSRVAEPELIPITQQKVNNPKDPNKHYLIDLYFPQLKYGIEVDERYHMDPDQLTKDEEREENIKEQIGCEISRIHICDSKGETRSIEEINEEIERIVEIIKIKIAENAPLKWMTYKEVIDEVKERGIFDVNDNISYDSITDIYNICGGKRSGKDKGKDADKLQRCYYRLNKEYKLWVPILALQDSNGVVKNSKMGYVNTLSQDHSLLIEKSSHPIDATFDIEYKRVVFMRMKNEYGMPCIKFIGIFELTQEAEDKEHVHIYKRIAEQIHIDDLKP